MPQSLLWAEAQTKFTGITCHLGLDPGHWTQNATLHCNTTSTHSTPPGSHLRKKLKGGIFWRTLCRPCQAAPRSLGAPCVELDVAITMTGERAAAARRLSAAARRARCSEPAAWGRSSITSSFGPACAPKGDLKSALKCMIPDQEYASFLHLTRYCRYAYAVHPIHRCCPCSAPKQSDSIHKQGCGTPLGAVAGSAVTLPARRRCVSQQLRAAVRGLTALHAPQTSRIRPAWRCIASLHLPSLQEIFIAQTLLLKEDTVGKVRVAEQSSCSRMAGYQQEAAWSFG